MPRARRTCASCPAVITSGTRCDACAQARARRFDRERGSSTERGYTGKGHRRFRTAVLARDPICVLCRAAWSTVADHYPLSRKQLVDRGLDPDDPDAGRGLCKGCHDTETATHQPGGWAARSLRVNRRVMVVAGPPCSGKNTFVAKHAGPDDAVVDFDEIMRGLTGAPLHHHDPALMDEASAIRDAKIADLMNSDVSGWIIASGARAASRHRYGVNVTLLLPTIDTTLARAAADRPEAWSTYIRDWYACYEPDARDTVLHGFDPLPPPRG